MPAGNRWAARLSTAFIAVILACVAVSQASGLTVRSEHPRLFYHADSMAVIRARCTGVNSNIFTPYKAFVDVCVRTPSRQNQYYVQHFALMHLLTGERQYTDLTVRIAMDMVRNRQQVTEGGPGPGGLSTLALAYDWAYDAFSPAQRDSIVQAFLVNLNHNPDGSGHPWLYWDVTWGYAYAIAGDAHDSNPFVLSKLQESVNYLISCEECLNVLAPNAAIDGYGATRAFKMMALYDCLKLGTDYDPSSGATYINNSSHFWMARFRPDLTWTRMPAKYNTAESSAIRFFSFFAARFGDRYAQSLARNLVDTGRWDDGDQIMEAITALAWYNPNLASLPLDQCDRDYYDQGMGVLLDRSGWNMNAGSTDITVGFFNGPDTQGHRTQNHFFITRGGDNLITDSGLYKGDVDDHYSSYYTRAVAHNTVLIYDPIESFGTYTNLWGALRNVPNDGGQCLADMNEGRLRWPACNGARGYRGEITQYEETADYVMAVGDASKAYAAAKVRRVLRRFVYLRPNWVLIQDQITLARPHLPVRAIYHSISRPEPDVPMTVVEGDINAGGVFSSPDVHRLLIEDGNSSARLFVVQAEGGDAEVRLVGGGVPGDVWKQRIEPHETLTYDPSRQSYEFYVDGTNFTPGGQNLSRWDIDHRNDGPPNTAGDWRTEVVVNNASSEVRITCLIQIAPRGDPLPQVTPSIQGDVLSIAVEENGNSFNLAMCPPGMVCNQIMYQR